MKFIKRWSIRILAGFGTLIILLVMLAIIFGDTDEGEEQAHIASIEATPTLTEAEVAYTEAVATEQAEATYQARIRALETAVARPTATPWVPSKPRYDLKLISFIWYQDYGYTTVEGFIENVSGKPLENIEAVAIFLDAGDIPISSDSALIDYDPLLPGQQSPFSIIARYNPAMKKCRVEFKEFWGPKFSTDYSAVY